MAAASTIALAAEANAQEIQVSGPLKGAPPCAASSSIVKAASRSRPPSPPRSSTEYTRTTAACHRPYGDITDWLSIGVWGGFGAVAG